MTFLLLFWTFLKIGAFSFGGGLAMIAPIQIEMEYFNWMTADEFANIIAVSQMTPGPIAVNTATYVGVKTAGVLGSLCATLGVTLPSFLMIILIAHYYQQYKNSRVLTSVLRVIKPVTLALIASAVVIVAKTSFFPDANYSLKTEFESAGLSLELIKNMPLNGTAVLLSIVLIPIIIKFKINPVVVIVASACLGLFLM
ncbi:MAG: chromate transporter [Spirochaetes bacterium]|jgi:chromate transporter|nr:chromate transporter [Spirochaetota bacterium]